MSSDIENDPLWIALTQDRHFYGVEGYVKSGDIEFRYERKHYPASNGEGEYCSIEVKTSGYVRLANRNDSKGIRPELHVFGPTTQKGRIKNSQSCGSGSDLRGSLDSAMLDAMNGIKGMAIEDIPEFLAGLIAPKVEQIDLREIKDDDGQ